jgi:DNA-binding PadR family transcriptional regulator
MEPRLDRLEAEGFLESDKASDPSCWRYRVTEYGSRALARASADKRTLAAVAEDLGGEAESLDAQEEWFGGRYPEESR